MKARLLPVSAHALRLRIDRTLKAKGQRLKRAQGRLFHLSDAKGLVGEVRDLQKFAREIGVLHPYEELVKAQPKKEEGQEKALADRDTDWAAS